ncbi:jordan transposition protein [Volvox carteri f. nagariensis]|uniref:Jordan transposition protein n=1 Tax=Volvox carteri f. nagariensis TaxID=3068 RepID=D8U904_VOLCA|nr:jordan transposition protein [Volvox carteri f. nagariensis]EFJ43898.1 jordan transposition protein [Volvox carteri f. nagariensis]|eukprot:XP_002955144.1 jordan transposition protein [Volvox carteri f. nagariensis]
MRFSAGNEVERTLVGMLGSGAKEESLKRYIRSLPEHSSGLCTMPGVPARSTALSEHATSSFALHLCAASVITSQAASTADRTGNEEALKAGEEVVTSGGAEGGDAAMVDPVKHGGTGDAGEYGVSEDGTEVSGAGQSNGLAPSEAGEQSEELVHRGFGVCNETRKRKRAPNMTRLVADDEEQQREMDRGHNDTDDAIPRYPCMAGQQEEDTRGGRAAMPSPRFPCTVRQQEGGASATVQLPPPAPEDARGGEAAALPSPSAAGPAAMPSPRFPCTVRQQEGGASATVQLPPPAPEDDRGGPRKSGIMFICDITDGKAYIVMKESEQGGQPPLRDTDILLGVFTDGVQTYKDDASYSLYPVAITAYNFSPDIRYTHGATTVLGILPGSRKKDEGERPRVGCMLKLLSRELESLAECGVDTFDAHTESYISVRVRLLTAGGDYRAIEDMLRMSGVPRVKHGCYKCWTAGSKGVHTLQTRRGVKKLRRMLKNDKNDGRTWRRRVCILKHSYTGIKRFYVSMSYKYALRMHQP